MEGNGDVILLQEGVDLRKNETQRAREGNDEKGRENEPSGGPTAFFEMKGR